MQPIIMTRPTFIVVGMQITVPPKSEAIGALWGQFGPRMDEIRHVAEIGASYGIIDRFDRARGQLDYLTGLPVSQIADLPDGMVAWQIPANTYAVVTANMPTLAQTFDAFFAEWLPESGYVQAPGPYFEYYAPTFDPADPSSPITISVPVQPASDLNTATEPAQTIAALQAEFASWQALLARYSAAQIVAPALHDRWSLKDTIAHLWAWQQRSIARMQAARAGHEPHFPAWPAEFDPEADDQPHDLNAWLYATYQHDPWPLIHDRWQQGFREFLALAAAHPPADLLIRNRYPWLADYALIDVLTGSLEHHREHLTFVAPYLDHL